MKIKDVETMLTEIGYYRASLSTDVPFILYILQDKPILGVYQDASGECLIFEQKDAKDIIGYRSQNLQS